MKISYSNLAVGILLSCAASLMLLFAGLSPILSGLLGGLIAGLLTPPVFDEENKQ